MARPTPESRQVGPALLLVAILVYACGGDTTSPGSAKIARLIVSPTALALFSGDTSRMQAYAVGAGSSLVNGAVLRWASSDTMVASIDGTGAVLARGNGDAFITVSADTASVRVPIQVNASADAMNTKVSTNEYFAFQEEPSITMDAAGRLFIGWKEVEQPAWINRVAFSASMDNGRTWTSPTLMDLGAGIGASDPWLATDKSGGLLYARVHTTRDMPWVDPWRIVVSRSTNGGLTWGGLVVTDSGNGSDKPALGRDASGNVLLTYVSYTTEVNQISLSRSLDNGATWEPRRSLPGVGSLSHGPVVAGGADSSAVVAWWSRPDQNVVVAAVPSDKSAPVRSTRVNTTFGTARFFLNQGLVLQPVFPSIARLPSGRVIVGWPDYAGFDWNVMSAFSDDGGITWSAPVLVNDARLNNQWMIALTAGSDGTLHAAWYDARDGDTHVAYARSMDGGATWSRNVRVTSAPTRGTNSRIGDYLSIAADGAGNASLVWTDARMLDLKIYFARITK